MRLPICLAAVLALSACAQLEQLGQDRPAAPTATPSGPPDPVVDAPPPAAAARTAEDLDTTTDEQRSAASAGADAAETRLGTTVASLGDPTDGGFWIETPLADSPGSGRVELGEASARVALRPADGPDTAGSRLSIAAFRLLGAPLTDLPTVTVFRLPEDAGGA